MNKDENDNPQQELFKSKSQVKREMIALQELGERLVGLNKDQLNKLELPQALYEAVQEAQKLTNHGARRRQFQYIGRLMRNLESPRFISDYFEKIEMKNQRTAAYHHMLEAWRERLIIEDDVALTEFITLFPSTQRQHLRQLVQNAKKERILGKPLGAARNLFRYLRELQSQKEEAS